MNGDRSSQLRGQNEHSSIELSEGLIHTHYVSLGEVWKARCGRLLTAVVEGHPVRQAMDERLRGGREATELRNQRLPEPRRVMQSPWGEVT